MPENQEAHIKEALSEEAKNNKGAKNNKEAKNNQETEKNRLWLNNYVGRLHLGELTYEYHDQRIPGNRHIWTATVQLNGTTQGKGEADTKGPAGELAAKEALANLISKFGPVDDLEH